MIDNDLRRRRERSYFCLVAIYVIHAILLNVFAKPQLDVESSVRLSASYLQNSSHKFDSLGRNSSESIIINTVNAVKIVNAVDTGQVNIISSMVNSSSSVEGKKSFEESYDRSAKSSNNDFSQQPKSGGNTIRFLVMPNISELSRLSKNALDSLKTIFNSLSPATLGILSGCLVFLLTFTEKDYV